MTTLTCNTCDYMGYDLISLFSPKLRKCNRPDREIDLVSGGKVVKFCVNERFFSLIDTCGRSGQFHSKVFPIKKVEA